MTSFFFHLVSVYGGTSLETSEAWAALLFNCPPLHLSLRARPIVIFFFLCCAPPRNPVFEAALFAAACFRLLSYPPPEDPWSSGILSWQIFSLSSGKPARATTVFVRVSVCVPFFLSPPPPSFFQSFSFHKLPNEWGAIHCSPPDRPAVLRHTQLCSFTGAGLESENPHLSPRPSGHPLRGRVLRSFRSTCTGSPDGICLRVPPFLVLFPFVLSQWSLFLDRSRWAVFTPFF